jgi:beta-RFAP synthase
MIPAAAVRVRTGSRLHFGLIDPCGLSGRRFGGAGVMVEEPGLEVEAAPAAELTAAGPLAERALEIAKRFASAAELPPRAHVKVVRAPREHVGLGTGTQLALAVAAALDRVSSGSQPARGAVELAALAGRGQRSAIGVHGFAEGGFIADAGLGPADSIAPVLARAAVPEAWRVVIVVPRGAQGLHGDAERTFFATLKGPSAQAVDRLSSLVRLGMLPALTNRDLRAFGGALWEFGLLAGAPFQAAQGGEFARGAATALVEAVRELGVRGVGQSSWGPAVFAVVADGDEAHHVLGRLELRAATNDADVTVAQVRNRGAEIDGV